MSSTKAGGSQMSVCPAAPGLTPEGSFIYDQTARMRADEAVRVRASV